MLVRMAVEQWNPDQDGVLTEAAMTEKLRRRGFHVSRYVYPPGTRFPPHTHEVDKIDAVVAGRFRMTLLGQSFILEAGDCLAVPRGVVHAAEVVGPDPVTSLDAVRDTGRE